MILKTHQLILEALRINLDGTIPNDNPGLKKFTNWLPEIITIGVRNPQGIAISPHDGEIYFSQHGPRGGDNIGKIFVGEIMVGKTLLGAEENILDQKLEIQHLKKNITNQ